MGITNMFATIPGFLGPAVVGWLTNHKVKDELRHQFKKYRKKLLFFSDELAEAYTPNAAYPLFYEV
jgi:hypothetical protein